MAFQSPKPFPVVLAMTPAPLEPASSPEPSSPSTAVKPTSTKYVASKPHPSQIPLHGCSSSPPRTLLFRPCPKPPAPNPKLLLEVRDLTHPGAAIFFQATNPSTVLSIALTKVIAILYEQPSPHAKVHIPPTRSVSLILQAMNSIAYTKGSFLDDDHKQIHLSLDFIAGIACARQEDEIRGVIVHEMVHCWQWNADGTAPGGLIEGIADFVRLKAGLAPPHWTREEGENWDAGYQHTAYFLDWLEEQYGNGTVQRVNERLRRGKYVEREFWKGLFSKEVNELFEDYQKSLHRDKKTKAERSENSDREEVDKAEMIQQRAIAVEGGKESASSQAESQDAEADDEDAGLVVLGSDGEERITRKRSRKNRSRND